MLRRTCQVISFLELSWPKARSGHYKLLCITCMCFPVRNVAGNKREHAQNEF